MLCLRTGHILSPALFCGPPAAVIFAYQGQSMFLEIMREMRSPRHFPRAVFTANGAPAAL